MDGSVYLCGVGIGLSAGFGFVWLITLMGIAGKLPPAVPGVIALAGITTVIGALAYMAGRRRGPST